MPPIAYGAYYGNQNMRPFVELEGQIIEVEGEVSTLQDQVEVLVARVDTMEGRIAANDLAILDLLEQNEILGEQMVGYGEDIVALEAQVEALELENAELQAQIDVNGGDIDELQAWIAANNDAIASMQVIIAGWSSLEAEIANNNSLIAALQAEIATLNELLALKALLDNGECPDDMAIQEIRDDGSVVCEYTVGNSWAYGTARAYAILKVDAGAYGSIDVTCPTPTVPTGGGFFFPGGRVDRSNPIPWGWHVSGYNENSFETNLIVYAICLNIDL